MPIRINKTILNECKKKDVEKDIEEIPEEKIKEIEEHGCECCSPDSDCLIKDDWED